MLGRKRPSLAIVGALLLSSSLNAEVKVLKNFTLIDGTGRSPVTESAMIVNDGRITWIGREEEGCVANGRNAFTRGVDVCIGQTPPFINDPFFTRSVSQTTLQLLSNPERQKTNAAVPHFKEFPDFWRPQKRI